MAYVICDKCYQRRIWNVKKVRFLSDYRTPCCRSTARRALKKKPPSSIVATYYIGEYIQESDNWLKTTAKVVLMGPHKIKLQRGLFLEPTATVREGYRHFKCTRQCAMAEDHCRTLHRARIQESDWQKLLRS